MNQKLYRKVKRIQSKLKPRHGVAALAFVIVMCILFYHSGEGAELATLQIAARKVPLSASAAPEKAKGVIEPTLAQVLTDKETSLDISDLSSGYVFVDYTGQKERAVLEIYYGQDTAPSRYSFEAEAGWEAYALPHGSGTYLVKLFAYDAADRISTADDISEFIIEAEFDEVEPYRYENACVDYEADSPLVFGAAYLVEQAEAKSKKALSDKEKTELIVNFVSGNIKTDGELMNELNSDPAYKYFPRADEVFDSGKGVCRERAILAAAMLKSLRIPVKVYFGNVFMPQKTGDERYGYHAWISAYLDGEWAMYDPSAKYDTKIIDGKSGDGTEYLLDTVTVH
ncbi:hypothetical protein AGMMS49983_11260 [Clostridia bacterium]|nr:hypothetical protein AGMMS49983_11260 [Clostridia bacterium]